jgi:hypothetical protein
VPNWRTIGGHAISSGSTLEVAIEPGAATIPALADAIGDQVFPLGI